MNKKFRWLVFSGTLALVLMGCSKEDKNEAAEVSNQAQNTFLFFSQQSTNDDGQNIGDLYIHTMDEGGEEEKVASDVMDDSFYYNTEKDYVLYLSAENELYKVAAGQSKEKLAEDVAYFDGKSKDNLIIYRDMDENVYSIDLDSEVSDSEKIASEMGYYELKGKSIYYVSDDNDLTVYNVETREEKTIAEEVNTFEFNGKEILYTDEDDMLFYKKDEDAESEKITGDTVYLMNVVKVKNDLYFLSSEDDENELNVVNTSDLSSVKRLADDVYTYKVVNNEVVYLTGDDNLFSKTKDSDTSKKLATDVTSFLFNDGKLYVNDSDNTLFEKTEGSMKKVASEVSESYITDTGDIIYVNEDRELFVNNKKIQSDVQRVSNLEDSLAFATDENKLYFVASTEDEAKVVSDELDNYSTVSYLNVEIYRNELGFKDIAGYWKITNTDENIFIQIKENGEWHYLNNDEVYPLEVSEDSASLTSFEAYEKDNEDTSVTFELDGDTVIYSINSSEESYTLEKSTKNEADESIAAQKKEVAQQEERELAHEEALVEEENKASIESTLNSYFSFFEDSMYYGDTSGMNYSVSPSSSFYTDQKNYIESNYEKGIYVEENNTTIIDYSKVSDGVYKVSVEEDYTIYKEDGSTKDSVYTNVYTVEEFEDGWYITGLN